MIIYDCANNNSRKPLKDHQLCKANETNKKTPKFNISYANFQCATISTNTYVMYIFPKTEYHSLFHCF